MKEREGVAMLGRDRERSPALRERARPHTRPVNISLPPFETVDGCKAVTVEWLLNWAYAREKVHLARLPGMGASAVFAPRGFPGASSSERVGVAVGSSMNLGFEAPADAYAVAWAVNDLGRMARPVREYGLMGSRPDWTPHPVIVAERGRTGNALHIDRRGKRHICPFRLFVYRGDVEAIVAERRRGYSAWARAVTQVHGALAAPGVLTAHNLLPSLPPISPWDGLTG